MRSLAMVLPADCFLDINAFSDSLKTIDFFVNHNYVVFSTYLFVFFWISLFYIQKQIPSTIAYK